MTRARVARSVGLVALIFVAAIAGRNALAAPSRPDNVPLGPGDVTVTLAIQHSHFSTDHISVRPGTTVRFVVHNHDPIGHELIVGDAETHRRHEAGTEPVHPPRPGEISVPAGTTADTTFTFDQSSGDPVVYACHLPGHLQYGMLGEVDIVRA